MRNGMLNTGHWVDRGWGHGRVWRRFINVWTTARQDPSGVYKTLSSLDLNGDGVIDEEEFMLAQSKSSAKEHSRMLGAHSARDLKVNDASSSGEISPHHSARDHSAEVASISRRGSLDGKRGRD